MTGFEPLITSAVSGLAVPIFQSLLAGGGKVLGLFGKSLDENTKRIIFDASHQYETNYRERHGLLKVLGMKKPVELESIYTTVHFLDQEGIRLFKPIDDLEEVYRQNRKRSFMSKDFARKPGIEVANQEQFLMVLGGPGMGKSTFLRKSGLEALKTQKSQLKQEFIPVFIELKQFKAGGINLEDYIAEEFDLCGFPSADKFTIKALEEGKLLILLDGLDEVSTQTINEVITHIQNFVDKYKQNRFIASCRTAAYYSSFRRFTDVVMAEFDDAQIQQFINNWFQSELDKKVGTAKKCWETLKKPEYAAAKELAQNPLLLTLFCLVYDDSLSFPKNRATLYDEALDILLKKWAAENRIQRDPIYQNLNPSLEEAMLAEIAYTTFKEDRLFFSEREVIEQIKTFLAENLNAPTHLDGEQILKAIEIQQGILVERTKNVYSFSHLTFQEYLTAKYIEDNRLIPELVTNHLTEERWKEVFLLVAGITRGGVDELLLLMEKEIQKLTNNYKLQEWLRWVDKIIDKYNGEIKPVGKRALAIGIANAIANAYSIAFADANAIADAIANAYSIADDNANAKVYAIASADAFAIAIVFAIAFAIANAYAYAIAFADAIAFAIASTIDGAINTTNQLKNLKVFRDVDYPGLIEKLEALKNLIPMETETREVRNAFAEELREIIRNAFHLEQSMLELSNSERKTVENYLYANYLMLQCKESAVRGSRKTWEAIESRMLSLPPDSVN